MKQVLVYLKFSRVLHKNLHCTPLFILTFLMRGISSCIRLLHRKVWFIYYVTVDLHLSYIFVLSFGSWILTRWFQRLEGNICHQRLILLIFLDAPCHVGTYFPNQELNPHPALEAESLTTGPAERSQKVNIFKTQKDFSN